MENESLAELPQRHPLHQYWRYFGWWLGVSLLLTFASLATTGHGATWEIHTQRLPAVLMTGTACAFIYCLLFTILQNETNPDRTTGKFWLNVLGSTIVTNGVVGLVFAFV
ncbi:MAG: hypothetical protein QM776_16785 [Rhodocyclaceae bacterium]